MYPSDADLDATYAAHFEAVNLLARHRTELVNVISGKHTNPIFDVAQVYERKGRDEFAPLPAPCSTSSGDFIVTVQLRVPRWSMEWDVVNGVAEQVRAAKAAADHQVLLDRRAAVAAELAELDAQLAQE